MTREKKDRRTGKQDKNTSADAQAKKQVCLTTTREVAEQKNIRAV